MAVPHSARVITRCAKSTRPTNITHKPPQRRCLPLSVHSARPPLSCQRAAVSFHCVLNGCLCACVISTRVEVCSWSPPGVEIKKKGSPSNSFSCSAEGEEIYFSCELVLQIILNELKAKTAEYSPEETLAFLPSPSSLFHLHPPPS